MDLIGLLSIVYYKRQTNVKTESLQFNYFKEYAWDTLLNDESNLGNKIILSETCLLY